MTEDIQNPNRCPVCGKNYPEGDKFCGDDGTLLEIGQPLAAEAAPVSG
jgi:predicted nucleic acid-binding Zn ribbon protein